MTRARSSWPMTLAVVLALSAVSAAGAQPQPSQSQAPIDDSAAQAAYARLETLARASRARGEMPRIADPEVRQVLAAIWDARPLDPARRAGAADLPVLMRFCEAGGNVWRSYFQFNPRGIGTPDLEANMKKYDDEIMPGLTFSVRCSGAMMEAAGAFMATLSAEQMNQTRRDGWNRLRAGAMQVIQGAVTTLGDPSVSPVHARELARALNETGPRFAAGLEPAERQATATMVRGALPSVGPLAVRNPLEAFAARLSAP